ncbi:MAG: phosphorylase [Clostridium sp.]|nr:phosphorylase [Clostridium sp.]
MNLYYRFNQEFNKYNDSDDMLKAVYGLDSYTNYDAIIVAPSWTPEKVFKNYNPVITELRRTAHYCGYEVKVQGKKYGYLLTGSCSGKVIDCCMMLGQSVYSKIIFIGYAGSLVNDVKLGDIVTPSYSIAGDGGSLYLYYNISKENYRNKIYQDDECISELKAAGENTDIKVMDKIIYCTDTIFCEYLHLDEIKELGSEVIEMETAAFMRCMELMNKKYNIILCISDNSTCGNALIGRCEDDTEKIHNSREVNVPKLIFELT